jgi:hypothetical protein
VALLVTALDGRPIRDSGRLLLTVPGYAVGTQPGSDPPRPQKLIPYGSEAGWSTLEPDPKYPNTPSGNLNGGTPPVWMERVECFVGLQTAAARITVFPLDGMGRRMEPLASRDVQRVEGGFRIHLQGEGQRFSPWYEIIR